VEEHVTEIREPNFTLDLPGDWEPVESSVPATFVYRTPDDHRTATVILLAVRPVYSIADPTRLLQDYLHHRSNFERGQDPTLALTPAVLLEDSELLQGGWGGVDSTTGRLLRHRVVLVNNLLADFCLRADDLDEAAFNLLAEEILGSATVSAE
jgi:hypothetical protein